MTGSEIDGKSGLQLVLLDLDDTLYLERQYVRSGFRAVARHIEGRTEASAAVVYEKCRQIFKVPGMRGQVFNELLATEPSLNRIVSVSELIAVYRDHFPKISLPTDSIELLNWLAGGAAIGVITDGRARVQRKKVEALGLREWIDLFIFTEDLGSDGMKPSVVPFRHALEFFEVGPKEAIYIGDNPEKDFMGPEKLGMNHARIRRPGGLYNHLSHVGPAEPNFVIERLDEMIQYCR